MKTIATTERKPTGEEICRVAMASPAQARVDRIEDCLRKLPPVDCPLTHRFTPGLYIREIFMPKGTLLTSKIHKTEHPYVISKGRVSVWIDGVGVVQLSAPHCGITKPGTRRVIYVHEDCVWTTFHATNETDVAKIEKEILYERERPAVSGGETKEIKG